MKNFKDIKKQHEIYRVPEGYFDSFQSKMSELTTEETTAPTFIGKHGYQIAYVIPVLILLIITVITLTNNSTVEDSLMPLADISTGELIDFLEDDGISESELVSFLDSDNLSEEILDLIDLQGTHLLEGMNAKEMESLSNEFEEYL